MKFREDSEERTCNGSIPHARYEALACMRVEGHEGECIALMGDAARADGVCFGCRETLGMPHKADCYARQP